MTVRGTGMTMRGTGVTVRRVRRVLALFPSDGLGGAEAQSAVLLRALQAAGVAVTAAIEPRLRAPLARWLGPGAEVVGAPIGWHGQRSAGANIAAQALAAPGLLAAAAPDVVLLPLPWPTHGLGLMPVLAAARQPTLAVAHLAPEDPFEDAPAETAETAEDAPGDAPGDAQRDAPGEAPGVAWWDASRAAGAAAKLAWAAVSAPVAARVARLFGLPRGAVAVVPNGVAAPPEDPGRRAVLRAGKRAALGLAPDRPLLVFAGRLEEKKSAGLLPALAEHLAGMAGATLAVLGEGPLAGRLAAHPAAHGPAAPLRLCGQVADAGDWLLAADALVLPSRLEGHPLVFLEAAARRCPVVATAAALEALGPAAADVAALVPEPTVAALAAACAAQLAETPARAARLAAAETLTQYYDERIMVERYISLFRACHYGA